MIIYICDRCREKITENGLLPQVPISWRWHIAALVCGECAREMDSVLIDADFWETGED